MILMLYDDDISVNLPIIWVNISTTGRIISLRLLEPDKKTGLTVHKVGYSNIDHKTED